ncbi:DNA polymerase alpha subunit B [Coturnix japonica]|uniref:DNA polymerase alpha subunit B n=1 Tax=Coturnix japonica TaxID=93934 RepID=UPI0013A5C2C9|nr:DNA polymerase alpha subunit B [Coturnix japonica]
MAANQGSPVLSRRDRRPPPPRRTDSRCLHDVHTLHQLLDQEEEEEEEQLLDSYCTPGKVRPQIPPFLCPIWGVFGALTLMGCDSVGFWGVISPFLGCFWGFLVLFWRMEELGDALKAQHNIEEFGSLLIPAQDPMAVLGLIGCDSNGRLNALSVVLEGDRDRSAGAQIPLDLSGLSDFSLFPGQVVVVEGNNSTGKRMVVTRVYEFGPFLDTKHEQVESCRLLLPFAEVFRLCVRTLVEGTRSAGSHLVFIPSHRDAHHHFVYPQPPFVCPELPKEDKARVHFMPDPCTLEINGAVLGLTSTDVLFHLGTEEISRSSGTSDRFSRILQHILTQRRWLQWTQKGAFFGVK